MNISEYTYLINKPDAVNEKQTVILEKIVQEFPYFQSARALYLKGLYNQNSFKYNYVLKVTAAHTADRSVLFDFITSETFTSINKELYEQKLSEISDISVKESEVIEPKLEKRENTVEQSILSLIKEAEPKEVVFEAVTEVTPEPEIVTEPEDVISETVETLSEIEIPAEIAYEFVPVETVEAVETPPTAPEETIEQTTAEQKLEIGKPLEFSITEKHSFQEWLQLSKIQPIVRETENIPSEAATAEAPEETDTESDSGKQKKNELINRFIETNPKIPPVKHDAPLPTNIIVEPSNADNSYLMTETLARVYLEQKKYHKAIQAYQILILKYPEKSSFFADRILDIKNLQQNNKQ
ncbi:MAG TPA: hypothetical protein VK528_09375 [Flavobacterium sp.]|nr:hypothetical protein [Flavobacterium sp.]